MPQNGTLRISVDQLDTLPVVPQSAVQAQGDEPGMLNGLPGTIADTLHGVLQGAGNTAFDLGNLVHHTPIVGDITDALAKLLGPEGTNPDAAFSKTPDVLEPKNTAQRVGKFAEQVGEYMIPADAVKKGAVEGLVRLIPNSANPATMKTLNKVAAIAGRTMGEAGNAAAIGSLHGDNNVDAETAIAGSGPLVGVGLEAAVPLLNNPLVQKILPYLTAVTAGKMMGGISDMGIGAGLGGFGLTRALAEHAMNNPNAIRTGQKVARVAPAAIGRLIAGSKSTADTSGR